MARKKIKVTCPCVADRYTGPTERVVEFTGDRLGGLISIKQWEDGTITVEVYRADAGVKVRVGGQDHDAPR